MEMSEKIQAFVEKLPAPDDAGRFFLRLSETFPAKARKAAKNEALLMDILTVAAFSPLLATTVLQNPDYIFWLDRQRVSAKVRGKEEILESLARFALVNSQLEPNILLARFRRRELLRIYLSDIRGLETIAEITEEISNLADAILEYALRLSQQELANRYGIALEIDEKDRAAPARFCVVALGKLGSRELNYASDIDLLFMYSNEGTTSGQGTRGAVTNREYFIKLAEFVTKLVGGQSGEGAAYRVDLRLRPHGRVGALAISIDEAVGYYQKSARAWERQVLIRSRACAGDAELFQTFYDAVGNYVFSKNETVADALENVRLSKEKINFDKSSDKSFNVKLGRGGIREIEFIAQALQLAYGGSDDWLRAPHTLISLSRLADRNLLSEKELTELFEAYDFLRRVEHRLQMENGLQTHHIPTEQSARRLLARRMNFSDLNAFDKAVQFHTANVSRIYERVFNQTPPPVKVVQELKKESVDLDEDAIPVFEKIQPPPDIFDKKRKLPAQILASLEKSDFAFTLDDKILRGLEFLSDVSPHFVEMIASNPVLIKEFPDYESDFAERNYHKLLESAVRAAKGYSHELAILRKHWSCMLIEIVVYDLFEKIDLQATRKAQTKLAEASIEAALDITRRELSRIYGKKIEFCPFAVMGLGKLGGGGMDYGSDLDLVLIYDDEQNLSALETVPGKFFSRAVEIFVTTLSSLTREGNLYRVDLRLRPDGKNGATSIGKTAFLNYLQNRAAIWELLAYVKIRGAAGNEKLAEETEISAREIIHARASEIKTAELRRSTKRIRELLEAEKTAKNKAREVDIKFGAGGMLDIYFAARFLQLRDNVPDDLENRSTFYTLQKLLENGSLSAEQYQVFLEGYEFLTELDHNLRLTVGRSTRLPIANLKALKTITSRMRIDSVNQLREQLTFHRINIREAFDYIFN